VAQNVSGADEKRGKFYFRGGNLVLDFTNTVGNRLDPNSPRDYFQAYQDVLDWAEVAGIPVKGGTNDNGDTQVLRRAVRTRDLMYRVLASEAEGRAPRLDDVRDFNQLLAHYSKAKVLVRKQRRDGPCYVWEWPQEMNPFDVFIATLLEEAASILASPAVLRRLRMCGDEKCGWLFLDRSRAARRRWCSMADCGNRAKARRHYERQQ
jgi:predicted RNA-binding Zn ribbon-like protein